MNNSTKNLTLASVLTSLFIVFTIFAFSTGLAYGIYLDFLVPIFFTLVYLKCGGKYTFLSGICSSLLVFTILGDLAGAIFVVQGFLIGITCAYFMCKNSIIIEDMFFCAIITSFAILIVDLSTKALTGYSILIDFREMINWLPYKKHLDFAFYLLIAFYTAGMSFCIYFLALIIAKRINILSDYALKKWHVFKNLKFFNRFLCLRRKVFYTAVIYIILIEALNILNIKSSNAYVDVVSTAIQYISYYYIIRDSIIIIKDFIIEKTKKISYLRIFTLVSIILFILAFRLQALILVIISCFIDRKYNMRINQVKIVDLYYEKINPKTI